MSELKLKSDTAKRKRLFTAESFSHPAKAHIGMLEWILQEYTTGALDLTITLDLLYDMDKSVEWCDCESSKVQGMW